MTAAPDHADDAADAKNAGESGHSHGAGATSGRLAIALGLTSTFLVAELIGAYWFGSLALLSLGLLLAGLRPRPAAARVGATA